MAHLSSELANNMHTSALVFVEQQVCQLANYVFMQITVDHPMSTAPFTHAHIIFSQIALFHIFRRYVLTLLLAFYKYSDDTTTL